MFPRRKRFNLDQAGLLSFSAVLKKSVSLFLIQHRLNLKKLKKKNIFGKLNNLATIKLLQNKKKIQNRMNSLLNKSCHHELETIKINLTYNEKKQHQPTRCRILRPKTL